MPIREENIRLILGLKVKQLRLDNALSLSDLSKRTGISISYLNEIEKGKKHPKADKIAALADALNVSYDWLVSLQFDKKLAPLAEILRSNILNELPLDLFGIDPSELLQMLSSAPTKVSAFISTLIEIGRGYDMRVEQFYFSALRSFQEMHNNYFEEIEQAAQSFIAEHGLRGSDLITTAQLSDILKAKFNFEIELDGIPPQNDLQAIRSITIPGKKPKLLLNKDLSDRQVKFTLGKELAYEYLKLKKRPVASPLVDVDSFDIVLNHFKASYFSNAILIQEHQFIEDISQLFSQSDWQPEKFSALMSQYDATAEMIFYRLTNVLPKHFGINHLFFLRFNKNINSDKYRLTKELHLSGLHNPHATIHDEHYCRRWLSLTAINELENATTQIDANGSICKAQFSDYIDSDNKYLILTLAQPYSATSPDINSSLSIGLKVNDVLKEKVKFLSDKQILSKEVNETCERCSATDCLDRAAPAKILDKRQQLASTKKSLHLLVNNHLNKN